MAIWRCVSAVIIGLFVGPAVGQLSPFEDARWKPSGPPEVLVQGTWYVPISIDGVSYSALFEAAQRQYRDRDQVQRRLNEDLFEVFGLLDKPEPGPSVTLELRPVLGTEIITLRDVPMTRDNREWLRLTRGTALTQERVNAILYNAADLLWNPPFLLARLRRGRRRRNRANPRPPGQGSPRTRRPRSRAETTPGTVRRWSRARSWPV